MMAGLVAPFADVDLEDLDGRCAERIVPGGCRRILERSRERQRRERGALRRGVSERVSAVGQSKK
jgi:hypothetical protein